MDDRSDERFERSRSSSHESVNERLDEWIEVQFVDEECGSRNQDGKKEEDGTLDDGEKFVKAKNNDQNDQEDGDLGGVRDVFLVAHGIEISRFALTLKLVGDLLCLIG